jgi:hypothetical protein
MSDNILKFHSTKKEIEKTRYQEMVEKAEELEQRALYYATISEKFKIHAKEYRKFAKEIKLREVGGINGNTN